MAAFISRHTFICEKRIIFRCHLMKRWSTTSTMPELVDASKIMNMYISGDYTMEDLIELV